MAMCDDALSSVQWVSAASLIVLDSTGEIPNTLHNARTTHTTAQDAFAGTSSVFAKV